MKAFLVALILTLASLVNAATPVGPPASGPTLGPGAPAAAETRYQIGRALYANGKFADAAKEFRVALGVWPKSARLAYNLARSLERSGAPEEAIEMYGQYLALSPDAPDRAETEAVVRVLQGELARVRATLTVTSNPAGAEVSVDDGPKRADKTPLTLGLSPGTHTLRVELTGREPVERTIVLTAGRLSTLDLKLVALPSAPPAVVQPSAQPAQAFTEPVTPASESQRWRKPLALGLLGGAALALGAGAYFTWAAGDAADASAGLGPQDASRRSSLEDDLGDAELGMGLGFGLGAALAGVGAYLLLTPESGAESGRVAVYPPGNGLAALVRF